MAGIVGYGAYIPRNRIKVEEIAKVWGADAPSYKKGLMLEEKSVPSPDQDTITMSVEASKRALKRAGIDPREIGAVYVGSESHPYAVKPSGTVLAEAINATPEVHTADLEFACKAGTEGMFIALKLVEAGAIKYGLAVGADTSQGAPGDALEYSAAAGAAAFVFGKDNLVAEALETYSYTTDTPDFWRREYQYYPLARRPFHRRSRLFQAHHGRGERDHVPGRGEAFRLPVRHLPPAQRQVPAPGRRDLGLHPEADRSGLARPQAGQHLLGLVAARPDGDARHRQARRHRS